MEEALIESKVPFIADDKPTSTVSNAVAPTFAQQTQPTTLQSRFNTHQQLISKILDGLPQMDGWALARVVNAPYPFITFKSPTLPF